MTSSKGRRGECRTCKYAVIETDKTPVCGTETTIITCWRFPPSVVAAGNRLIKVRTEVNADDWCGEWRDVNEG